MTKKKLKTKIALKQLNLRLRTKEEQEVVAAWRVKNKKELNKKLTKLLLNAIKEDMVIPQLKKSQTILNEVLSTIFEDKLVPRLFKILVAVNDELVIQTSTIDLKLNQLIFEMGKKGLINNEPVKEHIHKTSKDNNWQAELKFSATESRIIKKKNKKQND